MQHRGFSLAYFHPQHPGRSSCSYPFPTSKYKDTDLHTNLVPITVLLQGFSPCLHCFLRFFYLFLHSVASSASGLEEEASVPGDSHHFTAFYFSKCNWFSEPPEPKGYREKWLIISPASAVQCAVPYLCPTSQCQKGLDCFNFLFTIAMQNVTCWGKLGKGYVKSLPYHFLQLHVNSQWSQNKSLIWRTEDVQGQYFSFICFYWVYNISNFLWRSKFFL